MRGPASCPGAAGGGRWWLRSHRRCCAAYISADGRLCPSQPRRRPGKPGSVWGAADGCAAGGRHGGGPGGAHAQLRAAPARVLRVLAGRAYAGLPARPPASPWLACRLSDRAVFPGSGKVVPCFTEAASWYYGELPGVGVQGNRSGAAGRGLPPALVELKAGLEAAHGGLPRENSGSRWPKVTLGALGDARRLLPDQLHRLNALCACARCDTLSWQ